jgi:hypothetical protein
MHERPICQLSIDRSSSAATSISITNPSINTVEEICHANGSTLVRPEGILSDAKSQVPLQTSAKFERTYNAQAHEIVDAMTAAVTNAQAGLNWLRAEPPDLEEVRQVLNLIARDGKRAAEIVIRLHALIEKVPTADAAL